MSRLKLKYAKDNFLEVHAFIIYPKEPFIEWLRRVDKTNTESILEMAYCEKSIYIVPDYVEDSNILPYIKKNYKKIFATELNNWYTEPKLWPTDVTFEMFKEWFEYDYSEIIYDMSSML